MSTDNDIALRDFKRLITKWDTSDLFYHCYILHLFNYLESFKASVSMELEDSSIENRMKNVFTQFNLHSSTTSTHKHKKQTKSFVLGDIKRMLTNTGFVLVFIIRCYLHGHHSYKNTFIKGGKYIMLFCFVLLPSKHFFHRVIYFPRLLNVIQ